MLYSMQTHKNTHSETWSLVSLPSSTDTLTLPFTCSAASSAPAGREWYYRLQCVLNKQHTHKQNCEHQIQCVWEKANSCWISSPEDQKQHQTLLAYLSASPKPTVKWWHPVFQVFFCISPASQTESAVKNNQLWQAIKLKVVTQSKQHGGTKQVDTIQLNSMPALLA